MVYSYLVLTKFMCNTAITKLFVGLCLQPRQFSLCTPKCRRAGSRELYKLLRVLKTE